MSKKVIQLSLISNQLKKEYWIHPILHEAIAAMMLQLGRDDAPYSIISDPQIGCETSQVARNFASWHCVEGHWLDTKYGRRLIKPDYLLMIDSDMSPQVPSAWCSDGQEHMNDPLDLVRYCDGQMDDTKYPVFGAIYPGWKYQRWFLHVYNKNKFSTFYQEFTWNDLTQWREHEPAVKSVDAIGTGAICIRREVLEAVMKRNGWRGIKDRITGLPVVFERGRDNIGRTFHGEDLMFCTAAKELGFEVYTSIGVLWSHYHTVDMLEIPAAINVGTKHAGPDEVSWTAKDYGLPEDWKLPEITAWSMTPGGCNILRELIKEQFPSSILQFGTGISSFVLYHATAIGGCPIHDLEHNRQYMKEQLKFVDALKGNKNHWFIIYHPLVDGFYDAAYPKRYELIVVDGPPSHEGTRRPAMYKVWDHWAVGGYLVLDDAQREPERSIVLEWKEHFGDKVSLEMKPDGYGRTLAVFRKERERVTTLPRRIKP